MREDRHGFGTESLPWQIAATKLRTLMQEGDAERKGRVMAALMQIVKLDLPALEAAYDGS